MANRYYNNIVITAETNDDLLVYIKASAEEDNLGVVDSVDAYISALNEGTQKAEDSRDCLALMNPPEIFEGVEVLSETSLSFQILTPRWDTLLDWAERILPKHQGITISGTSISESLYIAQLKRKWRHFSSR